MYPTTREGWRDWCVWVVGMRFLGHGFFGGLVLAIRSAEEIGWFQVDSELPCFIKKSLLMSGWDDAIRTTPVFRVGPTMDTAHVHAENLGDRLRAAALPDDLGCRILHSKNHLALFASKSQAQKCDLRTNTASAFSAILFRWI